MLITCFSGIKVHLQETNNSTNRLGGMYMYINKMDLWKAFEVVLNKIESFLGGYDELFYTLLIFVCIECSTKVMCAVIDKKITSVISLKGIFKKILMFLLVGVGNILDTQILGLGSVLRVTVLIFYISYVGVSFLQDAIYIGVPVPKKLQLILEQYYKKFNNKR